MDWVIFFYSFDCFYKWCTPVVEELGNNCLVELDDVNESPLDLVDVEFAVPGLDSLQFGVLGNEVGTVLFPNRPK